MPDDKELDTGRLEASYTPKEIDIWWLVAQVRCIGAKWDQKDKANRALFHAMKNQN